MFAVCNASVSLADLELESLFCARLSKTRVSIRSWNYYLAGFGRGSSAGFTKLTANGPIA